MFRAASRAPRRALLSASAAATTLTLYESKEKLSIYPHETPEIVLVDVPSPLEKQIGVARRQATQAYSEAQAQVQGWINKWIGVEHAVENRVKSIISPQESITPGILYVGIATLSGSIIARNRFIGTRLILPPLFFLLSADYFLPKTTANLSAYLGSLEETYLPTLAEKHEIAKAHSKMSWERVKEATADGRDRINRGAVVIVDKVQESTGLKIRETFGWTDNVVRRAESKVLKAVDAVQYKSEDVLQKVEEVKPAVEAKVEEKANKATDEVKRLV